jgi:putative transposase
MPAAKGHPARLSSWDYSAAAAYFVTFQVYERRPILGRLLAGEVLRSAAGEIVADCWSRLPQDFPVSLDSLVIMPDHVHAIVFLQDAASPAAKSPGWKPLMQDPANLLGKVIRAWKARATLEIRRTVGVEFGWQSRYFERVIRCGAELDRIRAYIETNPLRWAEKGRSRRGR